MILCTIIMLQNDNLGNENQWQDPEFSETIVNITILYPNETC